MGSHAFTKDWAKIGAKSAKKTRGIEIAIPTFPAFLFSSWRSWRLGALGGRGVGDVAEEAGTEYAGPAKRVRQGGPYDSQSAGSARPT